jgi:DNA-binding response OmpR family regulator
MRSWDVEMSSHPLADTPPALAFPTRPDHPERYTLTMGTAASPIEPRQVGILILDDDAQSQGALKQILDSEGWRVRVVPDTKMFLAELRTGEWSLVIANVTITGTDSPLFVTLRELTNVSVEEGGRLRALYLVPEASGDQYVEPLERAKLPYVLRPFHLHDFLEKVSDLLVEIKAIDAPIRQVRYEFGELRKKKKKAAKSNSMFASRESFSYTEEEIAEYEREESEALKNRRPKTRINLGDPNG